MDARRVRMKEDIRENAHVRARPRTMTNQTAEVRMCMTDDALLTFCGALVIERVESLRAMRRTAEHGTAPQ